jgi:hypothetical protein
MMLVSASVVVTKKTDRNVGTKTSQVNEVVR